jgi:hypothetical protein
MSMKVPRINLKDYREFRNYSPAYTRVHACAYMKLIKLYRIQKSKFSL